ncbi:hypothetical protein FRB90_007931 [Tulasnella sp. 427]|nr:hypothetical protein FRB90_007931 [Tulasnella sp. 427]
MEGWHGGLTSPLQNNQPYPLLCKLSLPSSKDEKMTEDHLQVNTEASYANALSTLILCSLNDPPSGTADQLARVDDFVVRALLESKYSGKRKRGTDVPKFDAARKIPTEMSLQVAREWAKANKSQPLSAWVDGAERVWRDVVARDFSEEGEVSDGKLSPDDRLLFTNLLMRYTLAYHHQSSVRIRVLSSSSRGERRMEARKVLSKGDLILEATGIESFGGVLGEEGEETPPLLVGPIRWVSRCCFPNCEMLSLTDAESTSSYSGPYLTIYALEVIRDIGIGEDITVAFTELDRPTNCTCSTCSPSTSRGLDLELPAEKDTTVMNQASDIMSEVTVVGSEETSKPARKRRRIWRSAKKLRPDSEVDPLA